MVGYYMFVLRGAHRKQHKAMSEMWRYDTISNSWKRQADMPVPKTHPTFIPSEGDNTSLYVASRDLFKPDVHIYDLGTDTSRTLEVNGFSFSCCWIVPLHLPPCS
eukprot:TRINITY_DN9178_c0_g3_i1.p1 TRINITY_DN9178_c0_g3~~TRINITY_DN9178_c0_g3_i1.p1  ORF type:complete len:105 (-),score=1.02 TRINITY_DN9178_c0_g3_i1:80-394(-)